ncbi:hypothetical protein B0H17DRAFT_1046100 [Mycena rosella]|uniref:Uncharacterized protein n=1 Tax=Mycena rosella TaxID=1033263 RepID=A0AAD7DW50_MYCRO|nr:hypothetical protein B0H17DRAFT_1046100 [Mycena rosella]
MTLSRPHTPTVVDEHIGELIDGLVLPGVCLTSIVLCAFAYTTWHLVSRPHLNRVSFRLLCFALVGNIMFSGGIFFCMALNLELVLVHQIQGQTMEKYYVLGAFILSALCNIVPYASGKYGWDEFNQSCWFSTPNERSTIKWLVGTQSFWVLLMSTGEVLMFLIIVGYLISQERYYLQGYTPPKSPIAMYRNTILRIVAYQDKTPILTELDWRLNIADLVIYSLRPLMYGVLAVTDPVRYISASSSYSHQNRLTVTPVGVPPRLTGITASGRDAFRSSPVALDTMETDQSSADSLKAPNRNMGGLHTRRRSAVVDLASQI